MLYEPTSLQNCTTQFNNRELSLGIVGQDDGYMICAITITIIINHTICGIVQLKPNFTCCTCLSFMIPHWKVNFVIKT